MLDDMATELRRLAKAFTRTGRGGKDLLEKLVIAEVEGVDAKILTKIRRDSARESRSARLPRLAITLVRLLTIQHLDPPSPMGSRSDQNIQTKRFLRPR